ncbi:unnamed protein product [Heterobilharzia americana]|nr:unnamed protein product [Heterobilharzia americana]
MNLSLITPATAGMKVDQIEFRLMQMVKIVVTISLLSIQIINTSKEVPLSLNLKRPVIICGPSGCGKSTCIRTLINRYPNLFRYCVSHTTRPRRPDEIHGRDYNFISSEEFQDAVNKDEFIEYAMFSGHYYGTSKAELKKQKWSNVSFAILEKRLRSRSTESEDRILQRLAVAHQEMQYGISEGKFDAVIVNDSVDKMIKEVVDVLKQTYLR